MIKKGILLIGIIGLLFSCNKTEPRNYAKLSGTIENVKSHELIVKSRSGYIKKIKINENGAFSDTLHLKNKGELFIFSSNGTAQVFLKNNDDVKISFDTKKMKETLKFTGEGAETSNYLAEKNLLQNKLSINKLFELDKASFDKKNKEITDSFLGLMDKYKNIDTAFYKEEKVALKTLPELLNKQYDRINNKKNENLSLKGKPSPEFNNYENFKGGKTSLKDLRGNYVYIDVWATWCGPCKREIPYLKKLEEEFKGKKIKFVSISVDRETAKEAWKKMIIDKKMGGIQLFALKGDSFAKDYKINSIPRFILLDKKGNIVNANMSRPSNTKTKEVLTNLLK